MKRVNIFAVLILLLFPLTGFADDAQIKSAESAAFPALSSNATIQDWDGNVLRKGTNCWTCLPDRPDTPGNDPWCVDKAWMNFLDAYKNKKNPTYKTMGVAYMLQGDTPVSNTDPYATKKTTDEDWVTGLGPHLMLLDPDPKGLEGHATDWKNGGTWIMWKDTPYAHLMVPLQGIK